MAIEISKATANAKPLIEGFEFNIGDTVYMNNYGEGYYATKSQWLAQDYRDVGFSDDFSDEQYADCFNGSNEWFTKFEIVSDDE